MCDACDNKRAQVIDFNVDDFIRESVEAQPELHELLYNTYRTRLLDLRNRALSTNENTHDEFFSTIRDIEGILEDPSQIVVAEEPLPQEPAAYSFAEVASEAEPQITPMDPDQVSKLFSSR